MTALMDVFSLQLSKLQLLDMHYCITTALYALAAECLRRFVFVLLRAFTGPLSKIPGPLWYRFHWVPWMYTYMASNIGDAMPALFEKYGNIVRVGPDYVIVTGPKAVHQILGEEDFPKSPKYELLREDRNIRNTFTETDKIAYKQRVSLWSWFSYNL
jgi:hypothetical protein